MAEGAQIGKVFMRALRGSWPRSRGQEGHTAVNYVARAREEVVSSQSRFGTSSGPLYVTVGFICACKLAGGSCAGWDVGGSSEFEEAFRLLRAGYAEG